MPVEVRGQRHARRARSLIAVAVLLATMAFGTAGASARAARTTLTVRGSVEQVDVTGGRPGARLVLLRHGRAVALQRVDGLGGALFRNVTPGAGYRVSQPPPQRATSRLFKVLPLRSAPPDTSVYDKTLPASGYGYLATRDGTKLAIDVRLPGGPGPYPTLIEYAGYGYADPAGPDNGIAQIANLVGFAVVDVNMRGTGCSGGAFDYFEPLQSLDGYDVIETVARQPWVLHHKVGMMGISYGGISQLFVGSTDPPSLAAIAPLSVVDSTATTLYPGGILNTGFAVAWAQERQHDAEPASASGRGEPWALKRIQGGDLVCRANQALHGQAAHLLATIRANHFYVPAIADPLDPITFVDRIKVPVYLACQWTDEQTGGHCADLAQHFTGTSRKWFTFTNGMHIDSLDPDTFTRWYDFLELYIARRAPNLSPSVKSFAPTVYKAATGISGITLPNDPLQGKPSYSAALTAFQHLPAVRILFDNGAGTSTRGAPYPAFAQSFSSFPLPGTSARSWFLTAGGGLAAKAPRKIGADRFIWNPHARPARDFTGDTGSGAGGLWTAAPTYDWTQNPPGSALSYLTAPLRAATTVVGAGALEIWIKASTPSVDLQATISEVRPDGNETFVQSGWLRASERKLDPRGSTQLAPVLTLRRSDAAPLPKGRWTEVVIPLYYEGHSYRRGSRIRVIISAPGGDQPIWGFSQTNPSGTAEVSLAHSSAMPSRLILPVVSGISVPTGQPPCPSLRGEPCRQYRVLVNRSA